MKIPKLAVLPVGLPSEGPQGSILRGALVIAGSFYTFVSGEFGCVYHVLVTFASEGKSRW